MKSSRNRAIRRQHVSPIARACLEALEHRRLLSRPSVIASAFEFETAPHKVTVQFDQNVSASLSASDLRVEAVTSAEADPVPSSLTYDSATNTATFAFNGILPEANYRAVLASEDVTNATGEALLSDHTLDFFFLNADATRDRAVNLADHNRLSANYGGTNKTFSQGDFNYDTLVNMADFNILSAKFGSTLPAPPSAPGMITVRTVTNSLIEIDWIDNVQGELGWRVQWSFDGQNFNNYTNLGPDTETFEHSGLPDATKIWYRVRAYGNGQDTAYTPKVGRFTVVNAPDSISAFAVSSNQIHVSWQDLSQNETGYEIKVFAGGSEVRTITGLVPNTTAHVVDNLQAGVDYTFSVRATGGEEGSAWTASATATQAWGTSLEVYFTNFQSVGNEWAPDTNETHPMRPNDKVLGLFDNESATLTLTGLPEHTAVKIEYTAMMHVFNSGTSQPDPDAAMFTLTAAGQEVENWRMDGSGLSTPWIPFGNEHIVSNSGGTFSATFAVDGMDTVREEKWCLTSVRVTVFRPTVTISTPVDVTGEGWQDNAFFRFARSGDLSQPLEVSYRVLEQSTAQSGTDYTALPGTITIPAGMAYADAIVEANDDESPEWTEDVWVELLPKPKYYAPDAGPLSVELVDDDLGISDLPELIEMNNDDDDDDGVPDKDQAGSVNGEDDLHPVTLNFPQDVKYGATVTLERSPSTIRVWENADRSGTKFIHEGQYAYIWTIGQDTPPDTVYVEAYDGSSTEGEILLTLKATDVGAAAPPRYATWTQKTSAPATSYGVVMKWRNQDVTNRTAGNVLIGEKIAPTLEVRGPWTPGEEDYLWTIPGPTFKDYTTTPELGQVVRLGQGDTVRSSVAFYWSDATSAGVERQVFCAVKVKPGLIEQRWVKYKVFEPTSEFTLLTANVGIQRNAQGQATALGLFTDQATVNADNRKVAGMVYNAKVELPAQFANGPQGEWYVTQRITSWNYATTQNGVSWRVFRSGESMLLDGDIRKVLKDPANRYADIGDTAATGPTGYVAVDSPMNPFGNIGDASHAPSPMTWTQRDDQFDAHLMFVPPGADSKPVPLKHVTSDWGAAAFYDGNVQDWVLDQGHPPYKTAAPQAADTATHPEWPKNKAPTGWEVAP